MRISARVAVARKVFAAVPQASLIHALNQALGQQTDHAWVVRKRPLANDAAAAIVQVQHGGKAHVHAAGAQLRAHHIAAGQRRSCCGQSAAVGRLKQRAQGAHGRQVDKAIGFEALHTAAFMVHRDQQVRAHALDARAQGAELGAVFPVAAKQGQAAHQRVAQALAVFGRQRRAGNIDHQRGMDAHGVGGRVAAAGPTVWMMQ